jgi:heme-degrading monooxygenase HmoA
MSVFITLRVSADPAKLEEFGKSSADVLKRITDDAKGRGAIHHQFYGADGEVLVVDEWESAEAFQEFFSSQQEIPALMQASGASGEPKVEVWRMLDVGDEF